MRYAVTALPPRTKVRGFRAVVFMKFNKEQTFTSRSALIEEMAFHYGWKMIDRQENIGMISFERDNVRINIYVTKMTVATCLPHPTKGATQLFRKNVSGETLQKIFINPRVHTDLGYYEKPKGGL